MSWYPRIHGLFSGNKKYRRGYLYNWYTINTGKLCPSGWHIATVDDFTNLATTISGYTDYFNGKFNGVKAGERYIGVYEWDSDLNDFTNWRELNNDISIWTSSLYGGTEPYYFHNGYMLHTPYKRQGFSIRCVYDGIYTTAPDPMPVMTDADGNTYQTVHLGNRIWVTNNLRTTHYTDASSIAYIGFESNWVLPSIDELTLMYQNIYAASIGSWPYFSDAANRYYWSSSEDSYPDANVNAKVYHFDIGSPFVGVYNKAATYNVRAIRISKSFSPFNIGDETSAGYVFYQTYDPDTGLYTKYISATSNSETNYSWAELRSGYSAFEVGTSDEIGSGQLNTYAINPLHDVEIQDSAAELCGTRTRSSIWDTTTNGAYCAYNDDINYINL